MEDDDLETTMRHGLQELANDAPRGDGLWETTTSMIAIQPEQSESAKPPPKAAPEPRASAPSPQPSPPQRNTLALGIVIGLLVAILIAVGVILAVVLTRNSSSKSGAKNPTPAPTVSTPVTNPTQSTTPATGPPPAQPTSAVFPTGPIPPGDVVFNDDTTGRIVVADAQLNEIGLIVPSDSVAWRAVLVSSDRTHVFVTKVGVPQTCSVIYSYDLTTHATPNAVISTADLVALSPDGSKAIVQWGASCSALAQQPQGRVALRDLTTNTDVVLPEVANAQNMNVAWSPDSGRVAIEPVGSHHVVVYDNQGHVFSQISRPASSQAGVGWTSDGLILVDLGFDKTAVLRTYDPHSGAALTALTRIPRVYSAGDHGPLVVPQVSGIQTAAGRTYVELGSGAGQPTYGQLRVIDNGSAPIVRDSWFQREVVG